MRIALVSGGRLEIPPKNWGAAEGIIWNQKLQLEQRGHRVDLYNNRMVHEVIHSLNSFHYDFIHCHTELFALPFTTHLRGPYALTSHFGGLHQFTPGGSSFPSFEYLFRDVMQAPAVIVLSSRIRELYVSHGYAGWLRVLRNGVEADQFRVAAQGNGRAICVGRIEPRKRQSFLADLTRGRIPVDFVGPWNPSMEPRFRAGGTVGYLGVWDKATLYDRLTDYSCLVLLSESEAAPLVVLEALAAGLSVVISDACTANLTEASFITVLDHKAMQPDPIVAAITAAIAQNAQLRQDIRRYACDGFSYANQVTDYLQIIDEYRQHFASQRWTSSSAH